MLCSRDGAPPSLCSAAHAFWEQPGQDIGSKIARKLQGVAPELWLLVVGESIS